MKKGYLFVFEGPDGVGKTTLANKVFEYLVTREYPVSKLSFPGKEASSLGSLVYQVHHNPESLNLSRVYPPSLQIMHVAAHADAISNKIIPLYESKKIIILDRYWWSTVVYGRVSGVDENVLKSMIELELHFWKDIKPDILHLIDRETPLRKDEDSSKWKEIKTGYSLMSIEERGKYPIVKIINDKSIELAQKQIISNISEIL